MPESDLIEHRVRRLEYRMTHLEDEITRPHGPTRPTMVERLTVMTTQAHAVEWAYIAALLISSLIDYFGGKQK